MTQENTSSAGKKRRFRRDETVNEDLIRDLLPDEEDQLG